MICMNRRFMSCMARVTIVAAPSASIELPFEVFGDTEDGKSYLITKNSSDMKMTPVPDDVTLYELYCEIDASVGLPRFISQLSALINGRQGVSILSVLNGVCDDALCSFNCFIAISNLLPDMLSDVFAV